ncbi:MAG: hypothetical protein JW739_02910 [Opitutales bacterium]|nr:hypothetical protein [Opitutales bacterium]
MSLINDALRKTQQTQSGGTQPMAQGSMSGGGFQPAPKSYTKLIIGLFLAGCGFVTFLVVGGYVLFAKVSEKMPTEDEQAIILKAEAAVSKIMEETNTVANALDTPIAATPAVEATVETPTPATEAVVEPPPPPPPVEEPAVSEKEIWALLRPLEIRGVRVNLGRALIQDEELGRAVSYSIGEPIFNSPRIILSEVHDDYIIVTDDAGRTFKKRF